MLAEKPISLTLIGLAVLPHPYTQNPTLLPYITLSANQMNPCLLSGSAIGRLVLCWREMTPGWIQDPRGQWEERNEEGNACLTALTLTKPLFFSMCFVCNLWFIFGFVWNVDLVVPMCLQHHQHCRISKCPLESALSRTGRRIEHSVHIP